MANKNLKHDAPVFPKESLVKSEKFKNEKDLLNALLKENEVYSVEDVNLLITNYKKGKVN